MKILKLALALLLVGVGVSSVAPTAVEARASCSSVTIQRQYDPDSAWWSNCRGPGTVKAAISCKDSSFISLPKITVSTTKTLGSYGYLSFRLTCPKNRRTLVTAWTSYT
jgi:hypothetical protein